MTYLTELLSDMLSTSTIYSIDSMSILVCRRTTRAMSGVGPSRPISNRVVKHSSTEGTARLPCGRLGLCAIY
jgi:hypothetical protein